MKNFVFSVFLSNFAANIKIGLMPNEKSYISREHNSSAAISFEHTYSAQELGEMMNTRPLDLLKLDIGFQTRWFDCDYIEEILSFVREKADMEMFMTLIVEDWRKRTAERHPRVAYRDLKTKENIPFITELDIKLDSICKRLLADREQIQHSSSFRQMFFQKYGGSTPSIDQNESKPLVETTTKPPVFSSQGNSNNNTDFHIEIESLPESIRNKIHVSQQVFDIFVKQLNEDVWLTVSTNKGLYCDPLRFLCIKHEIVSKNMEREDFDLLLHEIVFSLKDQPSLMSSMGRSKLTASQKISRSLAYYDSPLKEHQEKVWQLVNDCEPLEEGLQPVYDAMENERISINSELLVE